MRLLCSLIFICFLMGCGKSKARSNPGSQGIDGATPLPHPENGVNPSRTTLKFMDDSRANPGIAVFIDGIKAAFDSGDQAKVLGSFSDIIEFDPGHSKGKDGVIEIWGLDGTQEKLHTLGALVSGLLSNGGCLRKEEEVDSTYTAPFYNCIDSATSARCSESGCGVADRHGADLFAEPKPDMSPIYRLEANEIIPASADTICTPGFKTCDWTRITTFEGKTGFLPIGKLSTESDGLIWLVKESGGWKIRVLRSKSIPRDDV
ncbi:MAG: hypothetical protein JWP91_3038 [Fibrobacteres bacterium]|nr:hypothetical protein [Fibrobacterota bacterium]